ncbi:MAG: family N-acetyltransferase [Glaciihabitans sp.]|nr:family N-acetyltransferase [Glaciihabitans sp.]
MADVSIEELAIPATLDAAGGPDFERAIEVGNLVEALGYGSDELASLPAEELPSFQPNEFVTKRMLVARVERTIVGIAVYETTRADGFHTAWVTAQVLPAFRRRGIGTALADAAEQLGRDAGMANLVVYTVSKDGPGPRLQSPTGFGSVPRDNDEVRFLLARGYELAQVERGSRIALPVPGLAERLAAARAASGPDFAVHTWTDHTPERWREDIAVLLTRMSTDEPKGALQEPEDPWTVERLLEAEAREDSSPRTRLTVAAEHLPSGQLVGFSELTVPAELDRSVGQESTLVLREHRGHRLGMLLKVANFDHLQRVRPGHPSIYTFNAEENRFMLSVNEAVGFVPFGYEGAWNKALPREP